MTTAFVFPGGGDLGAFSVGVAEALNELEIRPDFICGTSTGALIAPMVSIGEHEELSRIYTTVTKRNIMRSNWWRPWKLWRESLYHTEPLERLIRKTMAGNRYDRLMKSEIPVFLCSVACQTKEIWYWSQTSTAHPQTYKWESFDEFVRAVLASTNQPVIMPPVKLNGQLCFDGGVREVIPITLAYQLGASKIIAVSHKPKTSTTPSSTPENIAEIGIWSIDTMQTEIQKNDVAVVPNKEDLIIIRPHKTLPSNGLEFVPEHMRLMKSLGYTRTREMLG